MTRTCEHGCAGCDECIDDDYNDYRDCEQPQPAAATPLTDEQIDHLIQQHVDPVATYRKLHDFARAIEATHGITGKEGGEQC